MSDEPPKNKEKEDPSAEEEPITETSKKRIVILEERDIPFEEERPPNFSPHYRVKVHRVHRHEEPWEVDE